MSFVDDLRALADFYEANPDLPQPNYQTLTVWLHGDDAKEQLSAYADRLPRPLDKVANDYSYGVKAKFGDGLKLMAFLARDTVCERRQVGTRTVLATEERTEPVYEWTCPPLADL